MPSFLFCLKQNIANLELLICPRAPVTPPSSCCAAFSFEWVIWVFPSAHSSSLFHPAYQNPANAVCMTAFPVCTYCWAFIKAVTDFASWLLQHHFLGFGNCNLACSLSLQNIATKVFCGLTFDRESTYIWLLHLCHLRHKLHVLDMNICNSNSFSSSETPSKMLFYSRIQKLDWLTYWYVKTAPHCFLLLLCLPHLYSSIVLFVSLTLFILESLPLWSRCLFILICLALWALLRD